MNLPITPDRYERLDSARWIAAAAVVLLHSAAEALGGDATYGDGNWIAANVYDSAVRWCVPVFVMISGALLLDTSRPQGLRRFYEKRAARIVVPLVFWSLFYLGWRGVQDWLDQNPSDYVAFLGTLIKGTPYYHLWYLYMIAGLYLFAPFIRNLYAKTSPRARIACVVSILLVAVLDALYRQWTGTPNGFFLTWFLPYLGYFVAGRLIFEGAIRLPYAWAVLVGSILVTAAGVYLMSDEAGLNGYFYGYFSLTVPLMSLAMFQLIVNGPRLPRLTWLAPLTFGVYLVHPVFLDLATRTGLYRAGEHDVWAVPLMAIVVFALSALASWGLARWHVTRKLI